MTKDELEVVKKVLLRIKPENHPAVMEVMALVDRDIQRRLKQRKEFRESMLEMDFPY